MLLMLMMQVILMPTAATPKTAEWYDLQISKQCPDKSLKIRIAVRIDKPQNMKHFGYCAIFPSLFYHMSTGWCKNCRLCENNLSDTWWLSGRALDLPIYRSRVQFPAGGFHVT